MENERLVILQRDLDLLKTHLMHSDLSDFNKKRLLGELKTAKIVKVLPDDVVCLSSQVQIQEVASKQQFTFQLVLPGEANMKYQKISVFAPIGIALLGYRTGSTVQWEMPSGLKTFEILNVYHPGQEDDHAHEAKSA
jgi:regulator of nucleoside diphosphate kinase